MNAFLQFLIDNKGKLLEQALEHIGLTFMSLFLAILLAVPLGVWISRRPGWAGPVLGIAGVLQTIPSIALLGFLIPILGIGIQPAIVALFLYAILPILRNVYAGISGVDAGVKEAALGMGMSSRQVLQNVELPLAMPVVFAGIRTAAVINVGVATLAAYIGAGGLGEFIFGGIALNSSHMILAGALPAALLALGADQLLALLQKRRWRSGKSWMFFLLLPLLSSFYYLPRAGGAHLDMAFEAEFMGRRDGYDHLLVSYPGLAVNPSILNSALMYEALRSKKMDAICGYSTEGRIRAFNLQVLKDDHSAFPPYQCGFMLKEEVRQKYPAARKALQQLSGQLNDSTITELNYRVDYLHQAPAVVAREFLESIDLYQVDRQQGGATFTIGSKIFTEQYILTEIFALLIEGYTDMDAQKLAGLGGTKICFDALQNGEIDGYPEYSGTALQVLLKPSAEKLEELGDEPNAVYRYVTEALRQQFQIEYLPPLGFNNTYAIIVNRKRAQQENWENISDLIRH